MQQNAADLHHLQQGSLDSAGSPPDAKLDRAGLEERPGKTLQAHRLPFQPSRYRMLFAFARSRKPGHCGTLAGSSTPRMWNAFAAHLRAYSSDSATDRQTPREKHTPESRQYYVPSILAQVKTSGVRVSGHRNIPKRSLSLATGIDSFAQSQGPSFLSRRPLEKPLA